MESLIKTLATIASASEMAKLQEILAQEELSSDYKLFATGIWFSDTLRAHNMSFSDVAMITIKSKLEGN